MSNKIFTKGERIKIVNTAERFEGLTGEIIEVDFDNYREPLFNPSGVYPYRVRYEANDGTIKRRWAREDQVKFYIPLCESCEDEKIYYDKEERWNCPFCKEESS